MKKVFLISVFNRKTNEYDGNLNIAFETAEKAKEYINFQLETKLYKFEIVKVNLI